MSKTDIVEDLRLLQSGAQWVCGDTAATLEAAADEIERLRATLRQALAQHDMEQAERPTGHAPIWVDMARAALREGGERG